MSNLLVQNIKHTNNTTAIEINSSAQMTVKSDGGATTTSLQQGLCKAWNNFDNDGTAAFNDSFNFASITDNGTGQMQMNVTNAFSNSTYTHVGGGTHDGGSYVVSLYFNHDSTKNTTQAEFDSRNTDQSTKDAEFMSLAYFGDLA